MLKQKQEKRLINNYGKPLGSAYQREWPDIKLYLLGQLALDKAFGLGQTRQLQASGKRLLLVSEVKTTTNAS